MASIIIIIVIVVVVVAVVLVITACNSLFGQYTHTHTIEDNESTVSI